MHPPTTDELQVLHRAGRIDERINFARRLGNHRADANLLRDALHQTYWAHLRARGLPDDEARRIAPAPPPVRRSIPTKGARKGLVLLVDFQDHHHRNGERVIHQAVYGRDRSGTPSESMAAYYDRSSYHQLDLYGGTTLPWYSTPYPRSAVEQTDAGRERLIKEVLKHFHSLGHDFSQYDTNQDGEVDFFTVIWAGEDTGWSTFWWPYQASFDDERFSLDGIRFGKYAWTWESRPVGSPFDRNSIIHELGHVLGLPDYYDYDKAKGPRGGLGGLDMMDSAKHDHNCFSKWLLGWINPKTVTDGSEFIVLGASETSEDCVLIWPRLKPDAQFGEFFMVENRQKLGNDISLPGHGLVIWHVDARLEGDDFACDNSATDHKLLRLMEADGLEEIEAGGMADAGDFYGAGMSFGCQTVPSSNGYDNQRTGVEVKCISPQGAGISATFDVEPRLATVSLHNPAASPVPHPG